MSGKDDDNHPGVEDGREPPQVAGNLKDNLNFGWFSLPTGEPNSDAPNNQTDPRGIDAGNYRNRPPSQSGSKNRLPSRNGRPGTGSQRGSRPPSQSGRMGDQFGRGGDQLTTRRGQTPQQQQYQPSWGNSDGQPGQPMSDENTQRLVFNEDLDATEYRNGVPANQHNVQDNGSNGERQANSEIDAVDWPLSRAAQEMMRAMAAPPAEPRYMMNERKCPVHNKDPGLPPTPATPMPPLSLGGYRGGTRPTYSSWHEEWHRNSEHQTNQNRLTRGQYGPPKDHDIFNLSK